ncbi:Patched domain-containing protein 3 [Trichinella pseudospiralis]|uniref:Patched domain-containing protein 3 n=1 Tax=Trichinella pseudospiralis TaxID=6337 RepID=A0A0V1IIK9_TRIPS|nr:Patched domain-containing protein 3 [Trichinella pseudospiralis]KRZ22574.1 Patched domain-containing protein 3 [Trichinella pseudospiralis]KRZ38411.1 Patched domain-containing protein 3 [Trichinella pseudospiralis]
MLMELDNLHVKGRLDRLAELINLAVLSWGQVKNCPIRPKLRFGSSQRQNCWLNEFALFLINNFFVFKFVMGKCCKLDCLERRLSLFFSVYARFVSRHPWPFIVFPLLLNVALSIGLLYMNEITDATYLYTPTNARSKYEREVIHQKWPLLDGNYVAGHAITSLRECQSIVSARDGGNILRAEYAEAVNRLNLYIISHVHVRYRNRTWNYMDLCLHWEDSCFTNPQLGLISTVYQNRGRTMFNLTYPITRLDSQPIYLGSSLGGVMTNEFGHIETAKAWMLIYQLQFYPDNTSYVSGLWEKEFQRALLTYNDPLIHITAFHSQTLDDELERNADHLTPRFALCFLILLIFAIFCTLCFIDGTAYIDWGQSKPILALVGVISAGIGVSSAVGMMNLCGMIYTQIVAVMPFLIVSVRLDNTFLMISAIRLTSRNLPVEERMGQAMSEAAVSITITVLTDVFSFALGILTNIPAVQIFCAYTTAAIMTTFFNQLTIMMAVLVLTLRMEKNNLNCLFVCLETKTYKKDNPKSQNFFTRMFTLGSKVEGNASAARTTEPERGLIQVIFEDWYAPILMHPVMRTVVLVWFVLYLGLSVWFCSNVREGLEPVNLLVSDSYAIPHYRALEKYFWKYGTEVQVVVNNPSDLSNAAERRRIADVVRAFAESPHGMGLESVQFWLFEFERFLLNGVKRRNIDFLTPNEFYESLHDFLMRSTYDRFRLDVLWDEDGTRNQGMNRIKSYRFYIGVKDFTNSVKQTQAVQKLRAVADHFPDYNITTFNPIWLFVDQYQEILPNVLQEVIAGISVMVLIALLMIPHPCCSFWVAITIASIDIGVVGLMTVWGINLDTVSMITIIMSIGFSVDFSAHIAHAFVVSDCKSPTQRAKRAVSRMAWPVIQGGVSTILGVVVLSNLDSYMVLAFFKTVLLVIMLGMLHAIVFLPVLLSLFVHNGSSICCARKTNANNNINSNNSASKPSHIPQSVSLNVQPLQQSTMKQHHRQSLAKHRQKTTTPLHHLQPASMQLRAEHEYESIHHHHHQYAINWKVPNLYAPGPLAHCQSTTSVNANNKASEILLRPRVANYIPDPTNTTDYGTLTSSSAGSSPAWIDWTPRAGRMARMQPTEIATVEPLNLSLKTTR